MFLISICLLTSVSELHCKVISFAEEGFLFVACLPNMPTCFTVYSAKARGQKGYQFHSKHTSALREIMHSAQQVKRN